MSVSGTAMVQGHPRPHMAHTRPQLRRHSVVTRASTSVRTSRRLPALLPPDDTTFDFSDFANWVVPGMVMAGRYPHCEPSRCSSRDRAELQVERILQAGITTFVCLQSELPPQEQMPLGGVDGFLPYKTTAELIKSSLGPPPSLEAMMGLRNPTLNKFLPPKRKANPSTPQEEPSYKLNFVHYPIVDLGVPSQEQLAPFVEDLARRLEEGERLYLHCWGGRGRTGTVAACLLAAGWGLSAEEALDRVQRAFETRRDGTNRSPETNEQVEFVRTFISNLQA